MPHSTSNNPYELLRLIDSPADLRALPKQKLPQVCKELREYLLNSVSQSSGHLASGLGTVELTVALHRVYQTPMITYCGTSATKLIPIRS